MPFILPLEERKFTEFSPCDAGEQKCEPSHKFGPYIRNYCLIHFVISGTGTFKSPRGEYSLHEGQAFIIHPGEINVYEADRENPWEYIWVGFRGAFAGKFAELPDVFFYDNNIIEEIRETFRMEKGCEEMLTGVIFKLYARLFGSTVKNDYSNKVISFINSHYMEDIKIASIAKNLGLDRKYLARIFKESQGIDMKTFLINKRLHEAKKLLLLGFNVEESAYMVGYKDPFGFSKAFKKRYGKSPVSLKKKI